MLALPHPQISRQRLRCKHYQNLSRQRQIHNSDNSNSDSSSISQQSSINPWFPTFLANYLLQCVQIALCREQGTCEPIGGISLLTFQYRSIHQFSTVMYSLQKENIVLLQFHRCQIFSVVTVHFVLSIISISVTVMYTGLWHAIFFARLFFVSNKKF